MKTCIGKLYGPKESQEKSSPPIKLFIRPQNHPRCCCCCSNNHERNTRLVYLKKYKPKKCSCKTYEVSNDEDKSIEHPKKANVNETQYVKELIPNPLNVELNVKFDKMEDKLTKYKDSHTYLEDHDLAILNHVEQSLENLAQRIFKIQNKKLTASPDQKICPSCLGSNQTKKNVTLNRCELLNPRLNTSNIQINNPEQIFYNNSIYKRINDLNQHESETLIEEQFNDPYIDRRFNESAKRLIKYQMPLNIDFPPPPPFKNSSTKPCSFQGSILPPQPLLNVKHVKLTNYSNEQTLKPKTIQRNKSESLEEKLNKLKTDLSKIEKKLSNVSDGVKSKGHYQTFLDKPYGVGRLKEMADLFKMKVRGSVLKHRNRIE